MMKVSDIFVFVLIMGLWMAPVGTFFRWVVRFEGKKRSLMEALKDGRQGIPDVSWPVFFYGGWTCLIVGGVGTLTTWVIMWIVTGWPFRVQ